MWGVGGGGGEEIKSLLFCDSFLKLFSGGLCS